MSVFIIAECGSNWRFHDHPDGRPHSNDDNCHLDNAYRMIRAAKECGADAAKFQWVSDYKELMKRRGETMDAETERIYGYVHFPADWLALLKAECDRVGIQFGVTCYLPQDVAQIMPFTDFFKVAAKEVADDELRTKVQLAATVSPHVYGKEKPIYVSTNTHGHHWANCNLLQCVSKYPTPIDELKLSNQYADGDVQFSGLSDHTAHVLTGAVAVGAGARIIESHVRLHDTPKECPDYGHSLCMDGDVPPPQYPIYVKFIREAERML
jgi:sialic acid synthase SpsE